MHQIDIILKPWEGEGLRDFKNTHIDCREIYVSREATMKWIKKKEREGDGHTLGKCWDRTWTKWEKMNAKDEGSPVKRGSSDNGKIWAGTMERPSYGALAPWRLGFDTQWHHRMGKRPLKPQLKSLSLSLSLSLRDLLKVCAALWGLKHTDATEENDNTDNTVQARRPKLREN